MKKENVFFILIALMLSINAKAQGYFSENMFNHLAVGVSVGTPGIGFDLATTIGNHFQLRAGYSAMPKLKMSTTLTVHSSQTYHNQSLSMDVDFEGKLNMSNFNAFVDFFPFKSSPFHITVGAYIGKSQIINVYNQQDGSLMLVTLYNNMVSEDQQTGVAFGDYLLKPDANGNVSGSVRVNNFKPYVGLGFGRAVPQKNRIGFMFEFGCQFWGSPEIYTFDHKLTPEDVNSGGDDGGTMKVISKIKAYPVINFRLCGRIL
jgi:hypothetical protein